MISADLLNRYCSDPSRVRLWSGHDIRELGDAVLIVLATWSGESLAALQKLTEHFRHHPANLHVVDNDILSPTLRAVLAPLDGRGETFWVRGGQVAGAVRSFRGDAWKAEVLEVSSPLNLRP